MTTIDERRTVFFDTRKDRPPFSTNFPCIADPTPTPKYPKYAIPRWSALAGCSRPLKRRQATPRRDPIRCRNRALKTALSAAISTPRNQPRGASRIGAATVALPTCRCLPESPGAWR